MFIHADTMYTSTMNNFKDNVPIHWPTGVPYGFPSKNSILTTNNQFGIDKRLRPRGGTKSRPQRNAIGQKN